MIDSISLGVLGIGSGWAIVCLVVVMIFRGDLITRREARACAKQIENQAKAMTIKDQTISDFRESVATSNELLRALLDMAKAK